MIPSPIDHKTEALSKLREYLKDATVVTGFLRGVMKTLQRSEDSVANLLYLVLLDNAEGVMLDQWGALLDTPREGRSDAVYKLILRLVVFVNRSAGRTRDILQFAKLTKAESYFYIEEGQHLTLYLYNVSSGPDAARLLARCRQAGVRASLTFTDGPKSSYMRLGWTSGSSGAGGFGYSVGTSGKPIGASMSA